MTNSELVAAILHVGISVLRNLDFKMKKTLKKVYNCHRPSWSSDFETIKQYQISCVVAFAEHISKSPSELFVSKPFTNGARTQGWHAEERLLQILDRNTIDTLNISYSPCSRCVLTIISTFLNVEKKPTIRFLVVHGKIDTCVRFHAMNNLRLLYRLGYRFDSLTLDKLELYVVHDAVKEALQESKELHENGIRNRNKEVIEDIEEVTENTKQNITNLHCCKQNCLLISVVPTFWNSDKTKEVKKACEFLNELEFDHETCADVKSLYFPVFPCSMLVLRLIQVFYEQEQKPTILFWLSVEHYHDLCKMKLLDSFGFPTEHTQFNNVYIKQDISICRKPTKQTVEHTHVPPPTEQTVHVEHTHVPPPTEQTVEHTYVPPPTEPTVEHTHVPPPTNDSTHNKIQLVCTTAITKIKAPVDSRSEFNAPHRMRIRRAFT